MASKQVCSKEDVTVHPMLYSQSDFKLMKIYFLVSNCAVAEQLIYTPHHTISQSSSYLVRYVLSLSLMLTSHILCKALNYHNTELLCDQETTIMCNDLHQINFNTLHFGG